MPSGGSNKPHHGAQCGSFAAPGRSEESKKFPFIDIKVQIPDCGKITVFYGDILEFNHVPIPR
jgi:hypothetical protein